MYLKSIEIQGFKSFANKIKFEFHNGITAIVGPNGSGKSNVADAVRWVLGEQRIKQLRGGSMQDVIFSGTENRKPLSFAMVAITLDNSDHQLPIDFEEVTVTRKLYRSGESDYLINGSSCRLKDINELFYDTGIGKEGYSIIGQGQIDKILSGRPEERRELFDEAAGIVKFKRRKSASIKKLETERQNLIRVNDILSELEGQVGPLENQAKKAREYLQKKDELKRYDINLFLMETARLKEQTIRLDTALDTANAQLKENQERYAATKEEYQSVEEQLDGIELALEKSKNQLNDTTLLKQQLESRIEILKEQIKSARQNDEHYEGRRRTIQSELDGRTINLRSLEAQRTQLGEEVAAKDKAQNEASQTLVEVQSKLAEISLEIEDSKSSILEILNTRASTKAKIQKYDTLKEQLTEKKEQSVAEIAAVNATIRELESDLAGYRQEADSIAERISGKKAKISTHETEIHRLQADITKSGDEFQTGQKAYLREQSRLESLKNITERYDGYGNSIRRVMDQKDKVPGIVGVVADIIKTDKKYETAIETALGGSIQNIVTKDDTTAKQMIAYLKQNRFGRATFLPLTTIRPHRDQNLDRLQGEAGVIGIADDLVRVAPEYKIAAQYLLGRTLVVDHIDNAMKLARANRQSVRIVTLEGELINPGGTMSGGAFKNASNLLGRRREIEEFEKTVRQLRKELDEKESYLNGIRKQRADLYGIVDRLNEDLKTDFVAENTVKMNIDAGQENILRYKTQINRLTGQIADVNHQLKDISDNQDSILVELDTSETLEEDLNQKISAGQEEVQSLQSSEKEIQQNAEKAHLDLAASQQKDSFLLENIERLQSEIRGNREELAELDKNKGEAAQEIEKKDAEIVELTQTIQDSAELFAEIEQEIEDHKVNRENLNAKNKDFIEKREEISQQMSELDKEIYRLNSQKESLEGSSDQLIEYMWEEYELTYSNAAELRDETLNNLAQMKKRIQEIKSEIKALGSVNVNAIEDYKNVSERYEFLKTQHDDLIEAENTLVQIIEELDKAMRKQFNEQFALISVEYDKVFKELFGGGKGTLELMDDEDVLEAGIKIIAQPPGKKLQNMMQLSGGEKALTAIALLFAIQNLKPSPFCLLDEIEAALDDSNVTRFANYLHKLTKHTQFIVITHRRGTMTAADRLYGITMQEKGVSTLVSVSLLEDDLEK